MVGLAHLYLHESYSIFTLVSFLQENTSTATHSELGKTGALSVYPLKASDIWSMSLADQPLQEQVGGVESVGLTHTVRATSAARILIKQLLNVSQSALALFPDISLAMTLCPNVPGWGSRVKIVGSVLSTLWGTLSFWTKRTQSWHVLRRSYARRSLRFKWKEEMRRMTSVRGQGKWDLSCLSQQVQLNTD